MSIPIVFKCLQLRNFLSFGNQLTEIDLSQPGSTLIQGENLDTNSNNGAGKTTIINAICYVIYNKPFDNISLQRLVNTTNGVKNTLMEVRLSFMKGTDEYEIYRCRGESHNIQISCNGNDITLGSVAENDNAVEEIIGMSYDLFTKIVIFSGNSIPFLQLPVHPQRQLIEELFNITLLTEKAIKLKEIIRNTENSILVQDAIIKEQEGAINLYNKQLKDAKARIQRWEDERQAMIKQWKEELELLSTVDIETEKQLHEQVADIDARRLASNTRLTLFKKDQRTLTAEVSKLRMELDHLVEDKCPYCLQRYAGAADKLVEKQELLAKKLDQLSAVNDKAQLHASNIATAEAELTKLRSQLKFQTLEAILAAQANAEVTARKIEEMTSAVNPHEEALATLEQHRPDYVTYDKLNTLQKELEHQQFLLKLLTDKNSFIRRRIINRTIPFLNARLAYYIKQLGLPHVIKFDDDMTCAVAEYGRELDFGNLSSGEKKRVNLSLSLAFRDVLHHLHAKVNCLFIDEIDGSLDAPGVEAVFRLLKQKARDEALALWIISHRPEAAGRFDNRLIVRKQNGFSSIVDHDAEIGQAAACLT